MPGSTDLIGLRGRGRNYDCNNVKCVAFVESLTRSEVKLKLSHRASGRFQYFAPRKLSGRA